MNATTPYLVSIRRHVPIAGPYLWDVGPSRQILTLRTRVNGVQYGAEMEVTDEFLADSTYGERIFPHLERELIEKVNERIREDA